jgi:hypothetical protein
MSHFLVHFSVLFVQLLGVSLSRHDVLLHFFDLVIKNEFEFF